MSVDFFKAFSENLFLNFWDGFSYNSCIGYLYLSLINDVVCFCEMNRWIEGMKDEKQQTDVHYR